MSDTTYQIPGVSYEAPIVLLRVEYALRINPGKGKVCLVESQFEKVFCIAHLHREYFCHPDLQR